MPRNRKAKLLTIEEACASILGDELAHSIIMDMGVHWAVVAAMADARTSDDPAALAAIRAHNAAQRAVRVTVTEDER